MPKKKCITIMFTVAITSLTLVISLFPEPAIGEAVAGSTAYRGEGEQGVMMMQQATPPPYTCEGGERALLIQDGISWGGQANATELSAQGINFCMITSSQIGSTNLNQFNWIMISSDQNQTFYDNLFPSGNVHSALSAYVERGGTLSANLADDGWSGGNWDGSTFIDGLTHNSDYSQDNDIADPSRPHAIIAGGLPCPSLNCGLNVDVEGTRNDLDNWNYSSHGYFTNLPWNTTVILVTPTESGSKPVMIEYPFGAGRVIATLTTAECRYIDCLSFGAPDAPNKKLLANEIAYQDFAAKALCEFEPEPEQPVVDKKLFKTAEVEFYLLFDAKGNSFDVECVGPCTIDTFQLKDLKLDNLTLKSAPFDKPWGASTSPGCTYVRTRSGGVKKVCR